MIDVADLRFSRGARAEGTAFTLHVSRWQVSAGDQVSISGPSGSGKSTLLALLSGALRPHSGRLRTLGLDLPSCPEPERRRLRLTRIGQVLQDTPLVPSLDALENTLLPLRLSARLDRDARERARELLDRLGLGHRRTRRPAQLSQGERQRVGIARALVGEPPLVLADEPTASLDRALRDGVLDLLRERAQTLVVVSHDRAVLETFSPGLRLDGGTQC